MNNDGLQAAVAIKAIMRTTRSTEDALQDRKYQRKICKELHISFTDFKAKVVRTEMQMIAIRLPRLRVTRTA